MNDAEAYKKAARHLLLEAHRLDPKGTPHPDAMVPTAGPPSFEDRLRAMLGDLDRYRVTTPAWFGEEPTLCGFVEATLTVDELQIDCHCQIGVPDSVTVRPVRLFDVDVIPFEECSTEPLPIDEALRLWFQKALDAMADAGAVVVTNHSYGRWRSHPQRHCVYSTFITGCVPDPEGSMMVHRAADGHVQLARADKSE